MSNIQFWVDTNRGETVLRKWDQISLGGDPFPGLAQVETSYAIGYDTVNIKTPKSSYTNPSYQTKLFFKGYQPAKINVNFIIWKETDWIDFQPLFAKYFPKKPTTQQQSGISISHPACDLMGIDTVTVIGASLPQIVEQTMTLRATFEQYFPPAPLIGKFGNVQGGAPNADSQIGGRK